MAKIERRLRLATGLVLAAFVALHFLNHAQGVASIEAMDRMRGPLAAWWRSAAGTALLYGALLTHFGLGLASLYRRRTLRMPAWEAAQLVLGLCVLPLLVAHIVGTRFAWQLAELDVTYARVVAALWSDPYTAGKQAVLLIVVWLHLCFGLHFWLRLRPWYPGVQWLLLAVALLVPSLALAGFVSAGRYATPPFPQAISMEQRARLSAARSALLAAFAAALGATLLARLARRPHRGGYRIHHISGRVVAAPAGSSILEAVRAAGLAHASVCGGRARCTTCRVRVSRGLEALPPPGAAEAEALQRIDAQPNVRLACQTRPRADVWVAPLVLEAAGLALARRAGGVHGRERQVAAMFVDLRDSTTLGESRLPYDVVFILNQFFAEMSEALEVTGGHYAQFSGDGLLALYGLDGDIGAACRKALEGAAEMQRRMARLNERLAHELAAPLRIGIGLHAGLAIVGTMGPPSAPIISAIGDTVNGAARMEELSKHYNCVLVVSLEALRLARVAVPGAPVHHARLRGRTASIDVLAIDDPAMLLAAAQ